MGLFHEFYTGDYSALSKYPDKFFDLEIEGDFVSGLEMKPDHKWFDLFDLAVTVGNGYRVVYPRLVDNKFNPDAFDAHALENFYRQQLDEQILYNRPHGSGGGGGAGGR